MSFFAGGGWRSATSTVAQATTTTNTVSAARQASVDESVPGGTAERKPLLRAQTDPLVRLSTQNGSQTSLSSNPDPSVGGKRFTFRGVARALYFMGSAVPAATTTTVTPEETERAGLSSSSQSASAVPATAPVKRSTLSQEVSPQVESTPDPSGSPVSDGSGESLEATDGRPAAGRKSTSSSTGSTVVTEEPQAISQGLEEVVAEEKKSSGTLLDYSNLEGRIQELERENEEKSFRLQSVEDPAEREKAEFRRVHAAEMESQRREHQDALETLRHETRKAEERANSLARELEALQIEMTTRDEAVREMQVQARDFSSANGGLQDTLQQLKMKLNERETVVEEFRLRNANLESERRELERQRNEVRAEFSREKEVSEMALAKLAADHAQNMSSATNTISSLRNELSSSSATMERLRESLHAATRTADGLSETVDKRTTDVQRLQQNVFELQGSNQALEQRVDEMTTQMKLAEEIAARERLELCKKHSNDIDAERRIVRNLQSSLGSLQLEMGVTEDKVTALTREKNGLLDKTRKLEERCKSGEQQVEGFKVELTRANGLVHDLEEKGKVSREEARKEKSAFTGQLNLLRRQLDDVSKQSAERNDRIQILEATKNELTAALRRAQNSADEKDSAISELQHKYATIEKTRDDLEGRLADMERTWVETKEASQNVLDRTNENHEREMTQARARIQELQDELSSFITTAQQLHASLETSHADNTKAQQTIEEHEQEITQLLQRVAALQDYGRSLEVKNEEALSQMKLREQVVREEKAALIRSHAAEIQAQRTGMQGLKETLEQTLREKEERLVKLIGENSAVREELSSMKERSQKNEAEITAAYATLRDVTERNKASIERLEEDRAKIEDETDRLRRQADELQKGLREREEELEKLKAAPFHKMGAAISNALGGSWFFLGASSSASKRSGSVVNQTR